MRGRISGLVLAAGLSSRMGSYKPLMPLRGRTVIENTVDSLLEGGASDVVVVLGFRGAEVERLLRRRYSDSELRLVYNREFATTDMLHSIKLGLASLPDCEAFFLLPGDMPVVDRQTFFLLRCAMPWDRPAIVFPTLGGYRKHPPLIDARFVAAIRDYAGPDGLRGFWRLHEDAVVTVPVDDRGCWCDLDTFEQYRDCVRLYQ
ncbi:MULTISPECIES: nucleotidyltransferase family protein [Atopobiaceae]|uniref:Molybdenum cofactor cytidylyltransferase n=1 Tax=Parafannyhessea umbonata TaxID=604330 RepID=A0A1H9QSI8_9ACTN|nr:MULTISPECIES: nucleotidyltransferase family protein [Atopobiaceae]SEH44303.1 molybdenum cofactor cytidylyltransferase [Parafannyhessea umbonata]SER63347.1 molybdenum cofactor cytidylyltransferase [Parafannyhessea umbonata]SJZ59715.1 CTP:molybdopterin cytidylyltransferase MocA [Olsenella sp. KH1P3]